MIIEKQRIKLNHPLPVWSDLARRIEYDGYLYNDFYISKRYEEILYNKKIKNMSKFFTNCSFSRIHYPLEQNHLIKGKLKEAKKVAFFGVSESTIKALVDTKVVTIVTHPLEGLSGFPLHNIWADPVVETYANQLCYENPDLSKQYDLSDCYVVVANDSLKYGWILGQSVDYNKVFVYLERTSRFV